MVKYDFKNRYFREKLAKDIQITHPQIAKDYRTGFTASEIKEKYKIVEKFGLVDIKNNKSIDTAILMALGGYESYTGNKQIGLIPEQEYKLIAKSNHSTRGNNKRKKLEQSISSNNIRLEKLGIQRYSDEEKLLIWLGMYSKDLKDKKGRVQRGKLTRIINSEIFNGEIVRNDSQIRNIMTQYTKLRKLSTLYTNIKIKF